VARFWPHVPFDVATHATLSRPNYLRLLELFGGGDRNRTDE